MEQDNRKGTFDGYTIRLNSTEGETLPTCGRLLMGFAGKIGTSNYVALFGIDSENPVSDGADRNVYGRVASHGYRPLMLSADAKLKGNTYSYRAGVGGVELEEDHAFLAISGDLPVWFPYNDGDKDATGNVFLYNRLKNTHTVSWKDPAGKSDDAKVEAIRPLFMSDSVSGFIRLIGNIRKNSIGYDLHYLMRLLRCRPLYRESAVKAGKGADNAMTDIIYGIKTHSVWSKKSHGTSR